MTVVYFSFHKGHELQMVNHGGKAHIVCLSCGIMADVEAVSGEISPADAVITTDVPILTRGQFSAQDKLIPGQCRIIINQSSPGVNL
jgi:hypothetical protein